MKHLFSHLAALALVALLLSPCHVQAQDPSGGDPGPGPGSDQGGGVSYQDFYNQLGGQDGTWIQSDDYGYVFQPSAVSDPNWAPYTDGHWAYSDDGWVWVSDEPWGWATYHYGRWADLDGVGWVWVPGDVWAPAWVSWRYGDDYCGWAPLPPDTGFGIGIGFHFGGDADSRYHIRPGYYNFVRTNQLGDPNLRSAIIDRSQNANYIGHTRNVTNITVTNGGRGGFAGVKVGGPSLAAVNAHATHRISTVKLAAASSAGPASEHGNTLAVYAPRVNAATAKQGKPSNVSRNIGKATLSRGTATSGQTSHTAAVHSSATGTTGASAFTGENPAKHEETHTASPMMEHTSSTEPQHTAVEHHETAPTEHTAVEHSATPTEHHEATPTEHHDTATEHHESAPAQHSAPKPEAKPAAKPAGGKDDKGNNNNGH
jgi:hypothetical protein